MTVPIPTVDHNEALSGDTLYSVFLNFQWRQILVPIIIAGLFDIADTISDEGDKQDFENRIGLLIDDLYNDEAGDLDFTPVGTIAAYPSDELPAKWLLCDGALIEQAEFPELYAIIGNTFYAVPPTGEFGLPDLRSKMIFGADDAGNLADEGGNSTHTLAESELPAHAHSIAHNHTVAIADGTGAQTTRVAKSTNTGVTTITTSGASAANSGSVGNDAAFDIMNPYMRLMWMIKALP